MRGRLTHLQLIFIRRFDYLTEDCAATNVDEIRVSIDSNEIEAAQVDYDILIGRVEGCTPPISPGLDQEINAIVVAIFDLQFCQHNVGVITVSR